MDALTRRIGATERERLAEARVGVAGLGGLGSHIAVMLARSGVGALHLVDFDRVDEGNLNRQPYFREHLGRPTTEALAEQLRNGGNAAFQLTRRRKQRQHDTARSCYDLERHRTHAHAPCLAVRADQLLCRQVGQQQRTCDNKARQSASGQKIAVCGALVIALCFYIRNNCNKYRETDKRRHSPNHWNPLFHAVPQPLQFPIFVI